MASERHLLKRTTFLGRDVSIVLQNENGPCPLLGICTSRQREGRGGRCSRRLVVRDLQASAVFVLSNECAYGRLLGSVTDPGHGFQMLVAACAIYSDVC